MEVLIFHCRMLRPYYNQGFICREIGAQGCLLLSDDGDMLLVS